MSLHAVAVKVFSLANKLNQKMAFKRRVIQRTCHDFSHCLHFSLTAYFLVRGEGGMVKKDLIRGRLGAEVHPRRVGAEISLFPLPTMHCRPGGKR